MCGVVALSGKGSPELVRSLLLESNIRGQHATGISWEENGKIWTKKEPLPATQFLEKLEERALSSKNLIAHSRYSTSDLWHNQPIAEDGISVVHNGVVSQDPPEMWPHLFGYSCSGKNDSELILKSLLAGKIPLLEFPEASIASCVLEPGKLRFFRNGKRPLWYCLEDSWVVVSSTKDILQRSTGKQPIECKPFVEYEFTEKLSTRELPKPTNFVDLQQEWF